MKPTILFIIHMPPPVHGAAMVGKWVHDSKLVNSEFDCHFINLATARNLEDIGKAGLHKLQVLIRLLKLIRKTIRQVQPDLVYVTPNACGGAFYKDFVVIETIKRVLSSLPLKRKDGKPIPILVHYHNKGVSTHQEKWLDDKLYRRFFPGLKVMLQVPVLFEDMKKYVHPEQVFYCPNGNPETIVFEPKAERHNDILQILFLSNLIVSKGVLVLLGALKILKQKGFRFECTFIGGETAEMDGKCFDGYVTGHGLTDCVQYVGCKYKEEKKEYFRSADIFAFPSFYHNETFGLVNLEAMEWKLPIVTTDEGGIPDVVKDNENGIIVPCVRRDGRNYGPSAEDVAEALEKLLINPSLRHKMGEDGYMKFKDHFTLTAFERKFVEGLKWAIK